LEHSSHDHPCFLEEFRTSNHVQYAKPSFFHNLISVLGRPTKDFTK
jgi:hypothetical protein